MDLHPEEYELAVRARGGDRAALSDLIEQLRERLFALAYAELRHFEDAQDAVASALLQICVHVGELQDPRRVRAWMHQILRNEIRQIRRRGRGKRTVALEDSDAPTEGGAAAAMLRADIEGALRRLPRDQARALTMHYLFHLPLREIARRLGRPEGTIGRWLHQGRQQMAREMKGYAPMQTEAAKSWTTTILSTALDRETLNRLVDALKRAGFARVHTAREVAPEDVPMEDGGLRLAEPLSGADLFIVDDTVGSRTAYDVMKLLKATEEFRDRPVMTLQQDGSQENAHRAWHAGFDCFLVKPVDPEEVARFAAQLVAK